MLALTAPAPVLAIEARKVTREEWLTGAVDALRPLFEGIGVDLPPVRVSVGFPGGRGNKASVIGQCWHGAAAKDGVAQVFISPVLGDSVRVLDVLAHELVHAVNFKQGKSGHGAAFGKVARALGLTGAMTATVAGEDLKAELEAIAANLGRYPHAALTNMPAVPKQTTRMLKVECAQGSGYIVRMTKLWILEFGTPLCPCHEERMVQA